MKTNKWLIANSIWLILILAAVLRLYKLNIVPPGLTPDEASLGYNAYSILKTGKDEYGKILPVIFKSFGDYKPGLYVYTTVPFVALLGLNEWSVRLPSATAGILTVYLIYKIVEQMVNSQWLTSKTGRALQDIESKIKLTINYRSLTILAALVAATSPWLIYFSRGAWEANLSLTLTLSGIYFFIKSIQDRKFLVLTSIFFSLTLWTYQGSKLSTIIVLLVLLISFWSDVKAWFKLERILLVKPFLIGLIISIPIIVSMLSGRTGRLDVFSLLSYPRSENYLQTFLDQGDEKIGGLNYYEYHSEPFNFIRGIMGRWFNHFSGKFLFFQGDFQNPRHSAPNSGMLLLVDLILIPFGIIFLLKNNTRFTLFITLWLILSPLPAILSRDQVHAVRALNMSVPLILISSLGLWYLYNLIQPLRFKYFIYYLAPIAYFSAFIYFLDSYFVHMPVHNASYWQYGYKQAVMKISSIQNNYDEILFQQSYNQPYIYFLFYQKYDPSKYQSQNHLVDGGIDVGLVNKLDNISFKYYSWPPPVYKPRTLVAGDSNVLPSYFANERFSLISDIKFPGGYSTAMRILEAK